VGDVTFVFLASHSLYGGIVNFMLRYSCLFEAVKKSFLVIENFRRLESRFAVFWRIEL
jgi:hypothetical protein